jgi:hypothetical protein
VQTGTVLFRYPSGFEVQISTDGISAHMCRVQMGGQGLVLQFTSASTDAPASACPAACLCTVDTLVGLLVTEWGYSQVGFWYPVQNAAVCQAC